jgi:hypothetical protein
MTQPKRIVRMNLVAPIFDGLFQMASEPVISTPDVIVHCSKNHFFVCLFVCANQPTAEDLAEYRAEHPSTGNDDDDDDGEGTNMLSSYKCACQLVCRFESYFQLFV